MKILLINNFHYRKGGSEAVYFNMARMLTERGHQVIFFSCTAPQNETYGSNEYFVAPNDSLPIWKGAMRYIYNKEAQQSLEQLIRKERPDVAHIHLFWGGLSSSILDTLKKHRIPIVHTAHDYRMICPAYTFRRADGTICEACKGGKYYKCLIHKCSRNSVIQSALMTIEMYIRNYWHKSLAKIDGIVFVSHFAHDKHIEFMPQLGHAKSIVAYNTATALDQKFINNARGEYFLFFGRLSHEKGIRTLIQAVVESEATIRLKIVGTGPEEESLKVYVAQHGAESRVEFVGYRTGDELKEIIRDASFVVVPSEWYENNPMTIIEAYTAGVPVIGANIGGIPEIIRDGETGYLFHAGDRNSLKSTIQRAIATSEAQYQMMSSAARRFATENFSEENNYTKIINLYNSIIKDYER